MTTSVAHGYEVINIEGYGDQGGRSEGAQNNVDATAH